MLDSRRKVEGEKKNHKTTHSGCEWKYEEYGEIQTTYTTNGWFQLKTSIHSHAAELLCKFQRWYGWLESWTTVHWPF